MKPSQIEKIKDEALKELFRLKAQQLNKVRNIKYFRHPIATETIYLFNVKFDDTYEDERMRSILHDSYAEIQTNESRLELLEGIKEWATKQGYDYNEIFGK